MEMGGSLEGWRERVEITGNARDKRVKRRQKGDREKRGEVSKKILKTVPVSPRKGCKDSEAARRITNLWAPLVSYRRRLSISRGQG